jgi:D-aspartate ligase
MGRTGRRSAIYATSDAVLFAIALHRDELSKSFALYQPGLETVLKILDKGKLLDSAREVGIETPETWLPKTAAEAGRIASDVPGQLLIKPRSQLSQRSLTKGAVVDGDEKNMHALFNRYVEDATRGSEFARVNPEGLTPIVQRFYPEALDNVYSLTGFRDMNGQMVLRAARKILQMPRKVGVGLCFEEAPIDAELAHSASRLCEHIGYFGVFEMEFIIAEHKRMLIDFNGRFYGQMALDIVRGMNLPALAYAAATGAPEGLSQLMTEDVVREDQFSNAFYNGFELKLTIKMQRFFGSMSREEVNRWRVWSTQAGLRAVDAVHDHEDPLPRVVDVMRHVLNFARHPRAFITHHGLTK